MKFHVNCQFSITFGFVPKRFSIHLPNTILKRYAPVAPLKEVNNVTLGEAEKNHLSGASREPVKRVKYVKSHLKRSLRFFPQK